MSTPTTGGSTPSRSEKGKGAVISRCADAISLLGGFSPDYSPPDPVLSVTVLQTLHGTTETKHRAVAHAQYAEKKAQSDRKKLFGTAGRGIAARITDIGNTIEAKFGKSSTQYTAADALIDQMRGVVNAPGGPVPDGGPDGDGGVSQAQTSFGAITAAYAQLIELVTGLGTDYAPVKADIQPAALATHLGVVQAANTAVANKSLAARSAEAKRNADLEELTNRMQRVKAAVSAQYGHNSPQEKAIRKLKI